MEANDVVAFALGGIVLQHLLDWVKWHCDTADRLAGDVADSPEPVENYNYWPAVCCPLHKVFIHSRVQSAQIILFLNSLLQIYHLLFQGRIKEVRDLLAQHPDRNPGGQDVSA